MRPVKIAQDFYGGLLFVGIAVALNFIPDSHPPLWVTAIAITVAMYGFVKLNEACRGIDRLINEYRKANRTAVYWEEEQS
jgi:hypothetical protein